MTQSWSGTWGTNGFSADNFDGWRLAKQTFVGKRVTVSVEVRNATRSDAANRRYFGRIVRGVMGYYNAKPEYRELPLNKDQIHYMLASAFHGTVLLNGILVPKSTHDMPQDQFSAYCDEIESHYAQLGAGFPDDY